MIDHHSYKVECKNCGNTIILPILPEMRAKAKEDFGVAEQSAQTKLADLEMWLLEASLLDLVKYWVRKK